MAVTDSSTNTRKNTVMLYSKLNEEDVSKSHLIR